MSKLNIGIAVIVLATVLSAAGSRRQRGAVAVTEAVTAVVATAVVITAVVMVAHISVVIMVAHISVAAAIVVGVSTAVRSSAVVRATPSTTWDPAVCATR